MCLAKTELLSRQTLSRSFPDTGTSQSREERVQSGEIAHLALMWLGFNPQEQ